MSDTNDINSIFYSKLAKDKRVDKNVSDLSRRCHAVIGIAWSSFRYRSVTKSVEHRSFASVV